MGCRRENTGRGFTYLRTTLPVSEGQYKRRETWVIDNSLIELIATFWVCQYSAVRIWARMIPHLVCCAFDGGLSPLGNLNTEDAIDVNRQELTVDTYEITYYCSP